MMRPTPVLVAIALEFSTALAAAAQTSFGAASFSGHPVQLSAGLSAGSGGKSYGVGMAGGAAAGPYVTVGLTREEYDGSEGAGTGFSADAGYAINLNATKIIQFCPSVGFFGETRPDTVIEATTVHFSGRGVGFGGNIGGAVPVTPTLYLVPVVAALN